MPAAALPPLLLCHAFVELQVCANKSDSKSQDTGRVQSLKQQQRLINLWNKESWLTRQGDGMRLVQGW
jgi:hypothetical protein